MYTPLLLHIADNMHVFNPSQHETTALQVCRHHAAAVCDDAHGNTQQFACPYHGWVYGEASPCH